MCGIVGQIALQNECTLYKDDLKKMLNVIKHRGPDGEGEYLDDYVHIGMRRLSIIDLESGWQPIFNEDKSIVVVFNGEIYNYKELRCLLIKKGHVFRTDSDTEVIVHLYEQYGEDFIEHLNGMFAIAIYNIKLKSVLLIRDRLGIKPLYYYNDGNKFIFGSEIKSILQCRDVKRQVDLKAMNHLLSFNYVPLPFTLFRNIKKVNPGNYLKISDGDIQEIEFWDVPHEINDKKSESEFIYEFNNLLDDAVRLRLRSDVPVGAFLSGGVDSSTIVAKMNKLLNKEFNTFSIGFKEEKYSELKYSNVVSKKFGTKHISEVVTPNLINDLTKSIWYCDNPHGDVSFMPTNTLSKLASKYVTVVLTGDGGDELFGGYDKYKSISNEIIENNDYYSYFEGISVFNTKDKHKLYSDYYQEALGEEIESYPIIEKYFDIAKEHNNDFLNHIFYSEIKLLLEGNNLIKPDRMGMAESIEARVPLLDYRIVELASSIPSKLKIKDGETKYIMKKAVEGYLPNEIIYRKKQMFTVPIGEWFKKDLRYLIEDVLLDGRTLQRGYFNEEKIKTLIDDHVSETKDRTRELRVLLILEIWHRMYIDNLFSEPPTLEDLGIKSQ